MRITVFTLLLSLVICCSQSEGKTKDRSSPASNAAGPSFDVRLALSSSTKVMFDLVEHGHNPIPLSVLNATKCVVLVNTKGTQDATGIVSCRLTPNDWSGPAFISFHNVNRVQASSDRQMLVLLMSDAAVRSLVNGELRIGKSAGSLPGPLLPANAQFKENDIKAGTFTYSRGVSQRLVPATIDGSLSADHATTKSLYDDKADTLEVLTGRAPAPKSASEYVAAVGSFFNTITPVGIIIHHSSVLPTNHRVPTNERQVDQFHEKRGFAVACSGRIYHVAYHYFILPNGKVKLGRPETCQGAHAHGYNAYLGISLAGDFSSADNRRGQKGLTKPTAAQLRSLRKLCKAIMQRYRIPTKNVLRHSDVSNTLCPGDRFPYTAFMKGLERSKKGLLAQQHRKTG